MASEFYHEMLGIADELLTEFGESIQHLDANQTVLSTHIGLKSSVRTDNVPQTVIESSDATVYMTTGTGIPQVNNYLRVDGQIYNIVYVDTVRPTSLTLLYAVFISKGA